MDRTAYPLGCVVQLAYAVNDVRSAARSFAERVGAGPFFVRRHRPMRSVVHQDAEGAFDHSSAYGQWGTVQIELVEMHDVRPASLAAAVLRSSGIHHMAYFVSSIDDEQHRLERLGWPPVLIAQTASGLRFAFHDARPQLGHLIEIYEPSDDVIGLYAMVAEAAAGWTGNDPVREW